MRTLASTGADARAVPVWVTTPFGREDVLWGLRLEGGSEDRILLRDVAMFAPDLTYGDIVSVISEGGKLRFTGYVQKSAWRGYVAVTTSEGSAAKIGEELLEYPEGHHLAARFTPGSDSPILGLAIGPDGREKLEADLERWQKDGFVLEYTETTER